ncbi:unnamed protein product [Cuscuta epithymum]|uniref:Scarecrow-like protein 6 n=1 Tax=Cuscuta epithymum TaxID=186058 RepID=A0AAV0G8W6_9ASTE|nr:unnamed protein product [Cuscuta epithymum]
MIGMPYSGDYSFQGKGVPEPSRFGSSESGPKLFKKDGSFVSSNEPISVLDKRSPSPSTSTSASSSSFGGAATHNTTTAVPSAASWPKEEWAELQPLPSGLEVDGGSEKVVLGLEDWESLLYESAGGVSDHSLLPWVSGEFEDPAKEIHGNVGFGGNFSSSSLSPISGSSLSFNSHSNNANFAPISSGLEVKLQNFNFHAPMDQTKPYGWIQEDFPPARRTDMELLNPTMPFVNTGQPGFPEMLPDLMGSGSGQFLGFPTPHPLLVPKQEVNLMLPNQLQQQQKQVVYDQVYKAAELIQSGEFSLAQMILARLNHNNLSQGGKPLERAVSYFKEALLLPHSWISLPPPFDFVFKMGAYKVFSEVSPLLQFMHFTSNQTLLEAVGDAGYVHVFDFDIGIGAQWSSFMQELPRRNGGVPPSLKITAFASPSSHHPIEINLMHESLSQFANDVGVRFELEVVNLDTFDPSSYASSSFQQFNGEVIVVNFPIWSLSGHLPNLPAVIHYIKRLSPKVVVSFDRGCERSELSAPHHIINALKYYEVLLESTASCVASDFENKMERFVFQPGIERIVQGRLRFPDPMPPWRALFGSAGFLPVTFSDFSETQAECVVKRNEGRGFHVEKRQTALVLCWQGKELLTAIAWRC